MDDSLDQKKQTDEYLADTRSGDKLLIILTDAVRGLEAVQHHGDHYDGMKCTKGERGEGRGGEVETQGGSEEGMFRPAESEKEEVQGREVADEDWEEKECKQNVLRVLRELSVFHSDRVTAWREVLRGCAHMFRICPPEGSDQRHPSPADTESVATSCSDSFSDTFLSVGDDIKSILDRFNTIINKLDKEIFILRAKEAPNVDAARQETRNHEASEPPEEDRTHLSDQDVIRSDDQSCTESSPDAGQTSDSTSSSSDCNDVKETGKELEGESQRSDKQDFVSIESHTKYKEETIECVKSKEETQKKWITVRFTVQQEDTGLDVPYTCLIRAPPGVSEVLRCDVVDTLSYLMVTGSEELLSRVIRVRAQEGAHFPFPVTVVVPFCAHNRSSYRDVVVKILDKEGRSSSITPVTTEGTYGGQRGSFAEARVYSLGLFAVVLCLKRENYTVPTKGLSFKLPMEPRISLNYLPASFTAPIMAQIMIQPLDAVLLAAVKSRSESYRSVVSTSPLLYLSHPSSQPLKRPLTLTLLCPPNPEKKRRTRGKDEVQDLPLNIGASSPWDQPRKRILVASVKSKETSNELLKVLGSRDQVWSVLDQVSVRNQKNGLVSLELTENFDRLLVVRLLSLLEPSHLTSLAEELEEWVCRHTVTIVLQRRQDKPNTVLVAALPSRDLGWELSKLRAQGYIGLSESFPEISMCEGDQLVLRFSGNITATGIQNDQPKRIAFHSQQKNQLFVHLREVDPFGNYSSPHYKGTVMFYKVTRGHLESQGDRLETIEKDFLGDPICKLSLSLPKKVRTSTRPTITRVKLCEETDFLSDALLLWLSAQLSEEEVALLVLSLHLRRSAAQLVKLRGGDSLSTQAFHALAMWRRGLPANPHQPKAAQLAHCLAKSGRPDLARELLRRQGLLKQGSFKSINDTDF